MCIVPHELLQFIKIREIPACENINDEFSYIIGLLKFYQNNEENTVHRNSEDQYEYDKLIYIPHVIKYINIPTSYHHCYKVKNLI